MIEAFGLKLVQPLTIQVLENDDWQNDALRWDVNADGLVTPEDALVGINEFNRTGARALPAAPAQPLKFYLDVTGDNQHTPSDIHWIVNYINQFVGGGGEGEMGLAGVSAAEIGAGRESDASRTQSPLVTGPPDALPQWERVVPLRSESVLARSHQAVPEFGSKTLESLRPPADAALADASLEALPDGLAASDASWREPAGEDDWPQFEWESLLDDLAADVGDIWSRGE